MIRTVFAASALLLAPLPALAQTQDDLDARYDRALAAGYKALMLCGAIANAERAGTTRSPESVAEWELSGIQSPQDSLIDGLPFEINRQQGILEYVSVDWDEGEPPRIAAHRPFFGCSILPPGSTAEDAAARFDSTYRFMPRLVGESTVQPSRPATQARLGEAGNTAQRAFAEGGEYGADARTTAVIVQRGGVVDTEIYREGFTAATPQRTWSVAKSIAASLVGAAVQRGVSDVGASAGLGLGEHDPRGRITIDDALRMATGRYTDTPGNRTDPLYFGGATVEEVALDWPIVYTPGSHWRYANNDTLVAVWAIRDTFESYPPSEFLANLGMQHTVAETDWQGNFVLSSQVWSTARDLARLGQLHLDDGVLPDGTRLLPEGWADYVSSPSGPQPENRNMGYGAGWWLFNNYEGIPADTFAAQGNRGQFIVVVPSKDVVIVRRGEDPAGGSGFDIQAFTRDVLASLEI